MQDLDTHSYNTGRSGTACRSPAQSWWGWGNNGETGTLSFVSPGSYTGTIDYTHCWDGGYTTVTVNGVEISRAYGGTGPSHNKTFVILAGQTLSLQEPNGGIIRLNSLTLDCANESNSVSLAPTSFPTKAPTEAPTAAPTTAASTAPYLYTPTTSCTYSTNGNAPCCGTATTIVIESSVAEIKAGAFQACTAVAVVDASQATSLVTIRAGAFYGMTSLLSVDLSAAAALTHIETDAFKLCAKLAQLKYPPGLLAVPGAGAFHSTAIEPTGVVWPSGGTPVCGGTEAYFDWAHACRGARTVVDALCSTSALDVASSACFPTMDAAAPQCVVEVDAAIVSAGALAWFTDPATLSLGMKLAANSALVTHVCVTH